MATSTFERTYMSLPQIKDKMAVACLLICIQSMHNDLLPLIFVNDIKIIEDNIMKNAFCFEIIVSFELFL